MKKYILILALLVSWSAEAQWTGTNPITTLSTVGIGTTTPATKLEVVNSGVSTPYIMSLSTYNNTITNFSGIRFNKARNTLASPSNVVANDIVASIFGSGRINAQFRDIATIQIGVGASPSSTSYPGFITFNTVPTGSIVLSERMRITEAGNVGIATPAASISEKLHVTGNTLTTGNLIFGVTASAGLLHLNSTANNFTLQLGATPRLKVLNTSGFVGIGNNLTPTEMLHVEGNILSTGSMTATGNIASTGGMYTVNSTTSNFVLRLNATDRLTVANTTGNVGIGTVSPSSKLHIYSTGGASSGLLTESTSESSYAGSDWKNSSGDLAQMVLTGSSFANGMVVSRQAGFTSGAPNGFSLVSYSPTGFITFGTGGLSTTNERMRIGADGNVGIGTSLISNPNGYKLAVKGKIGAYDLQIERTSTAWADYVFEPNYDLPTLNEVEQFIRENKHLKDVPSAKEVETNGYAVSTMDATLLKKVEELTLYIIDQQKQIDELRKEINKKKK